MKPRSHRRPRAIGRALGVLFVLLVVAAPQLALADDSRPVVAIVPMGKVPGSTVDEVSDAIRSTLDVDVRVEAPRPFPKEAWYAPRSRWRAEKILKALDADPPQGAWKVLVLTEAEISTSKDDIVDWGIGGLGNIGGRSCVVSTYLIRKHRKGADDAKISERIRKLAVHELGHTLGLPHCTVIACVMRDARGRLIQSLDASAHAWCGRCRKRISSF